MIENFYYNKYKRTSDHFKKIHLTEPQTIERTSPANIALIKYWGKYGYQMPMNPSISFTLSRSVTTMSIEYFSNSDDLPKLEFYLDNKRNDTFGKKLSLFLKRVTPFFPFLTSLNLKINSHNTFPHSAGIASSASAYSAMALCLCDIEYKHFIHEDSFLEKASFMARVGSGSACRSIFGPAVLWGKTPALSNSSNEIAVPINEFLHPDFRSYHDAILVIDSKPKKISSSSGHILMDHHPYADARHDQSTKNLINFLNILKSGEELKFAQIIENEALSLHGLLLSSSPGYILFRPKTIEAIERIMDFRNYNHEVFAFTLDAGPNIHILYPEKIRKLMTDFINIELKPLCENGIWIDDKISDPQEKK